MPIAWDGASVRAGHGPACAVLGVVLPATPAARRRPLLLFPPLWSALRVSVSWESVRPLGSQLVPRVDPEVWAFVFTLFLSKFDSG